MAGLVPFLPAGGEVHPLQSCVVRTKCKTAAYVLFAPQRLPMYGGYSTISVEKAYQAVIAGEMSLRKAAEEYGVARSTLHAKVQGKVAISVKSGAKKHLTDKEKERLVEFLAGCASICYSKSCKEVMAIAQKIAERRNPEIEITKGWWDSFKSRHPEVALRQAELLSYAQAVAGNPKIIESYFKPLADTLEANGLSGKPGQIFNCMPLQHK